MRSKYGTNVAFLDAILNSLMGISALFIISFLLINEDKKETDLPEPPVQIMAILNWPAEGSPGRADIDLWVQWSERDGDVVGFRSPSKEGIALELDDLGSRTDKYVRKGSSEQETIPINREVINFRRIPEDEITVNAMFYYAQDKHLSVPTTVQVYKLNPFSVIYEGTHILNGRGDEHTFVRFKMDQDGLVEDLNFRQKTIVYAKHPMSSTTGDWPTGEDHNPAPRQPSPRAIHPSNYESHMGGSGN